MYLGQYPGWDSYYNVTNPDKPQVPTVDYSTHGKGENNKGETSSGGNGTGGGQPRNDFKQAGGGAESDKEPPSLLKPLIYAAAAGAAIFILT